MGNHNLSYFAGCGAPIYSGGEDEMLGIALLRIRKYLIHRGTV